MYGFRRSDTILTADTSFADLKSRLRADGWAVARDSNFVDHCGPFWVRTEGGLVRTGAIIEEHHLNNAGTAHGGMVATLLDRALGLHVRQSNVPNRHMTVQLDIHFLEAIMPGSFVHVRCQIEHKTRTLVFVSGTAYVDDRPVARGNGVWKVRRKVPSAAATPA